MTQVEFLFSVHSLVHTLHRTGRNELHLVTEKIPLNNNNDDDGGGGGGDGDEDDARHTEILWSGPVRSVHKNQYFDQHIFYFSFASLLHTKKKKNVEIKTKSMERHRTLSNVVHTAMLYIHLLDMFGLVCYIQSKKKIRCTHAMSAAI